MQCAVNKKLREMKVKDHSFRFRMFLDEVKISKECLRKHRMKPWLNWKHENAVKIQEFFERYSDGSIKAEDLTTITVKKKGGQDD